MDIVVDSWKCGVIVEVCPPEWLHQSSGRTVVSRDILIQTSFAE